MKTTANTLPRLLAVILLLGSLSMILPLVLAVVAMVNGAEIPIQRWIFPLLILGLGTTLTWLLSRRQMPFHLYLLAFVLWLVAIIYYWWQALA